MIIEISVLLLLLGVFVAAIVFAVRAWRSRDQEPGAPSGEVIPHLLLALAVGVTTFSIAELAAAALVDDRFAGEPATRIAGSLAGIVVAGPIALLLGRRESRRRAGHPEIAGWPIYLAAMELVFLTAFFVSVGDVARAWFGTDEFRGTARWTDVSVFAAAVGLHWWARRREPPAGELGALPFVIGSAVSLVSLTGGLYGALEWLFAVVFEIWAETDSASVPAGPVALMVTAAPVWAYVWLRETSHDRRKLTGFYLGAAAALGLAAAIGAAVAIVATLAGFLLGVGAPAGSQFRGYPAAFALLLVAGAVWGHHRSSMDQTRLSALRGYRYAMSAVGLGALIAAATALLDGVFSPRLAGGAAGQALITAGLSTLTGGGVWLSFWRRVQSQPREVEVSTLPRRVYLVGGSVLAGLVAAGSLIATLVVVFRALLGEVERAGQGIRLPLTLTLLTGLVLWHLVTRLRDDAALREQVVVEPYPVTVICSDPGPLEYRLPEEARFRLLRRGDGIGVIDVEMAVAIVEAVATAPCFVWVDETGFRLAPADRG